MTPAPKPPQRQPRPQPPSREAIAELPMFEPLPLSRIHCVATAEAAAAALPRIRQQRWLGFDTESKPTFRKDEVSSGPHTVQLASPTEAWVIQLHDPDCVALAQAVLVDAALHKVGFGLNGDRTQIQARWSLEPQAVLDLDRVFRQQGYKQSIGVKTAIAILFQQQFSKSRKQSTTNWAAKTLSEGQLRYAANDAWAALRVAQALGLTSN